MFSVDWNPDLGGFVLTGPPIRGVLCRLGQAVETSSKTDQKQAWNKGWDRGCRPEVGDMRSPAVFLLFAQSCLFAVF